MGCRCRVVRKRANVANVGHMIEELQCIDELLARRASALELESDQSAIAALQVGSGPFARLGLLKAWIDNVGYCRMPRQVSRDLLRVGTMLAHPERQRLEPLEELEGAEGAHGST